MSCRHGCNFFCAWFSELRSSCARSVKNVALPLCVLIPLASGCASSAGLTSALPPAPTTPGAIVTDEFICIPHEEAAELLLWIERAEAL